MGKQLTTRQLRERKFLLWAPLFAVPLCTVLFWAVRRGGEENKQQAAAGFNTAVPGPHLKEQKGWNKRDYMEQEEKDSVAAAQRRRTEEEYGRGIVGDSIGTGYGPHRSDSLAEKVQRKSEELTRLLAQSRALDRTMEGRRGPEGADRGKIPDNPDIARLEKMMGLVKKDKEEDPEIRDLSAVLDKLIQAERPEMGKEKGVKGDREAEGRPDGRPVLEVGRAPVAAGITRLGGDSGMVSRAGFYGLGTNGGAELSDQGLAEAMVTVSRQVIKGSPVKMELLTDIRIGSVTIPRGETITGVAGSPGSERLPVSVSTIFYGRQSFPVALQVLGSDGLPGLPIPGSFSREALRESAGQGVSAIEPGNLDPSLGAQAASAGIQVARSLAGRKIRVETAQVQAGVRVYLQDTKH